MVFNHNQSYYFNNNLNRIPIENPDNNPNEMDVSTGPLDESFAPFEEEATPPLHNLVPFNPPSPFSPGELSIFHQLSLHPFFSKEQVVLHLQVNSLAQLCSNFVQVLPLLNEYTLTPRIVDLLKDVYSEFLYKILLEPEYLFDDTLSCIQVIYQMIFSESEFYPKHLILNRFRYSNYLPMTGMDRSILWNIMEKMIKNVYDCFFNCFTQPSSHTSISKFLLTGCFSKDEPILADFWKDPEQAFHALDFLKRSNIDILIHELLLPEKIHSHQQLMSFYTFLSFENPRELIEKIYANIRVNSSTEIVLTAPPTAELAELLYTLNCFFIIYYERSENKKKRKQINTIVEEDPISPSSPVKKSDRTVKSETAPKEKITRDIPLETSPWKHFFSKLPKSLVSLDLSNLKSLTQEDWIYLQNHPDYLLTLSSDVEIYDGTSIIEVNNLEFNIEWIFKNNTFPPLKKIKLYPIIHQNLDLTTYQDIPDDSPLLYEDFSQIKLVGLHLNSSEKLLSLLPRFQNLTFIDIQNPNQEINPRLFPILKQFLETNEDIEINISADDIGLHLEQMDINAPEFEDFLFIANRTIDYIDDRLSIQINEAKIQKTLPYHHIGLTLLKNQIKMEEPTYLELLRSCEEYLIDIQPDASDSDENAYDVYDMFNGMEFSHHFHTLDRVQAAPVLASECWLMDVVPALHILSQTRRINSLDALLQLFMRIVPHLEQNDLHIYYTHSLQLFEVYEKLMLNIHKYEDLITQCLKRKDFLHFKDMELKDLLRFIHAPCRVDIIYNELDEFIFPVVITALQQHIFIHPTDIRLEPLKYQLIHFFSNNPELGSGNEALVSALLQNFDSRLDPVAYVKLAYAAKKTLEKDHYSSILKGFQSLSQSVNPDHDILLYWALEILKMPPLNGPQSSSIVHSCLDLCFSLLPHNPVFFHEHREIYQKLFSTPLKEYLLHYLAGEKKGHLQLLEEEQDLAVSYLLSQSFDESALPLWNTILAKLHQLSNSSRRPSSIFNISLDHLTHPFQLQMAEFFISHQIHSQTLLTDTIFLFLMHLDTMTPNQVRYCQDHIHVADPALITPFINRKEFQALILDRCVRQMQIQSFIFLPIWSQINSNQLLDENRAALLSICNRIGTNTDFISVNKPLALYLYSILEEDPSLHKRYPYIAQFLIAFFLPSLTDNHGPFFHLLKAIDPDLIPFILDLLITDINKIDEQNFIQTFRPYAHHLIIDYFPALKTHPQLAVACYRIFSQKLTNRERSPLFNTNYIELLILLIKTRIPITSVIYPSIAVDILKRLEILENQSSLLSPEPGFLITTTLNAIAVSLDENTQKYCLKIIKENGHQIACTTIHSDNSIILDEILDLMQSHEGYPCYVSLQAILRTGHFEKMKEKILPFLKKLDQTNRLSIEYLYSLINIDILSEKQKSEMLVEFSEERQNQLLNFRYTTNIESIADLRALVKPQLVSMIVPEEAKTLNLDRFIELFDQLDLDKQDHGIDLNEYYTDQLTNPKKFREYLIILLTNIRERNPNVYAVPKEPIARKKFYLEIEDGLKTALYHIQNQLKNGPAIVKDFHPHLFGMCQAGSLCGKRYQDIARSLYCTFSGTSHFKTRSLQDQIVDICHNLAWKYARQISYESPQYVNTHFRTVFIKFWKNLIGPENGELEIQQEEDGSAAYLQELENNQQQYYDQFLSLFTPESCLNAVWEQYKSHQGEEYSIGYQKLFDSHNIPDEVVWGESYDDPQAPKAGFRILLKTLGIIKLKDEAPNFECLSDLEKS